MNAAIRQVITTHSKSFSLAVKLLPPRARHDAVVLYAWCRAVDDAVDQSDRHAGRARLAAARQDLEDAAEGRGTDPMLAAFGEVLRRRRIPLAYPRALLEGMASDVGDVWDVAGHRGVRYATARALDRYCFRVAGTVGLMMCHVMGVRREDALHHAAHLGMAMQLTNICRDVAEDWERGRLYLPAEDLGLPPARLARALEAGPLPPWLLGPVGRAIEASLRRADWLYRSGDLGMSALSARCALSARAARLVYARIGDVLRSPGWGCDPTRGRAVVSPLRKVALVARAMLHTALLPAAGRPPRIPQTVLRFEDVRGPP